jgi:outer membrane protein
MEPNADCQRLFFKNTLKSRERRITVKSLKERTLKLALLIAIMVVGVIGVTVAQSGKDYAAAAPAAPSAGVVDYSYLISANPDTAKADKALKQEQEKAQKEYKAKSGALDDKGKQDLERQLTQRIEQKRAELVKPILEKINATIKGVADSKSLPIVVNKNAVFYGGVDITKEVSGKITGK